MSAGRPLRIGTRRSALALTQARSVAAALTALGQQAELVEITTTGDRGAGAGDKARWVKELDAALLAGEIDLAVHSAKDVPGELPDGLEIAAVPLRADPRDVLCGADSLDALPAGARIGTSSLRRRAQLLAARDDLEIVELRGNVGTRLDKLAAGECDALVLALAGLVRLDRAADAGDALDPERFVPAPGQGTLAVQARRGDVRIAPALTPLTDPGTLAALQAERALCRELGASCATPVGALATADGAGGLSVSAFVGLPDGSAWVADRLDGPACDPAGLGRIVARRLLSAGAGDLLEQAAGMVASGVPAAGGEV